MDCSPPGSSLRVIFQAGILGVGCHFLPQGIFPPRDRSWVSRVSALAGGCVTASATRHCPQMTQEHNTRRGCQTREVARLDSGTQVTALKVLCRGPTVHLDCRNVRPERETFVGREPQPFTSDPSQKVLALSAAKAQVAIGSQGTCSIPVRGPGGTFPQQNPPSWCLLSEKN